MRRHGVTALKLVPSLLRVLLDHPDFARCTSLRYVFSGGEALPVRLAERFREVLGATLCNLYGPTEATVDVTMHEPGREVPGTVPIGRPIDNVQCYVLDARMAPMPAGSTGELHVGGLALARGYLNDPLATADRFVPHPFSDQPGARLYRTGDRVRLRPDGTIEFLGRLDHQVKLRGYRIELGEIEAVLCDHPAVRNAVVLAREEQPGRARLIGYVETDGGAALVDELTERLRARLPQYMVPASLVRLDRMPLTSSGKVNRRALPAPSDRPAGQRSTRAPRHRVERVLADIWAQVLDIESISIDESFFSLGGDSILSIQVVSLAREAGLQLTPQDLFKHQTIAELAAAAREATPRVPAERGPVTGSVPLTAIQRSFFARKWRDPHHYNQAEMLVLTRRIAADVVQAAFAALLEHHDALRMRYRWKGTGWQQHVEPPSADVPFDVIRLGHLHQSEQRRAMAATTEAVQAGFDLERGPLVQVVYFDLGSSELPRLFIAIHHLIVDGVSWRILLEDLERACAQLEAGGTVELPPKTWSFRQWATGLIELVSNGGLDGELDYWQQVAEQARGDLPVDHDLGPDLLETSGSVTLELDETQTGALLRDVAGLYNTQINDVLLTALGRAIVRWTGRAEVTIELEGHGREELLPGADVSRTVGWFTSVFPVGLRIDDPSDLGAAIKQVKEQLRAVPRRGAGFGLLANLHPDCERVRALREMKRPDLRFNYLGQLDQVMGGRALFTRAPEPAGPESSPRNGRGAQLEVEGQVVGGRLRLELIYSRNRHRDQTIQRLGEQITAGLEEIIAHGRRPDAGGYTPSDFPLAKLDQSALDDLVSRVCHDQMLGRERTDDGPAIRRQRIEAIYPMSPVQQGLVFHSLLAPGVYATQISFRCRGALDEAALERAWEEVISRHAVLRTFFVMDAATEPLQVVLHEVTARWHREDWRACAPVEQERRLEAYLRADRFRPFLLDRAPLMRLTLLRLGDTTHELVWTRHHALTDGWSIPILIDEVFRCYESYCDRQDPALEPTMRYERFIEWLGEQDHAAAERYWTSALAGMEGPTGLPFDEPSPETDVSADGAEPEALPQRVQITLSGAATAALQQLARDEQLTLNTIVHGAWALLLSRYSGERDVVYGATQAGRSATLPGIESMVGLFMNTLPARVHVDPSVQMIPWMKRLQAQQAEARSYDYASLVDVHRWADLAPGQPLFQTILVFENYPWRSPEPAGERGRAGRGLDLQLREWFCETNYPLTVVVKPGPTLDVELFTDGQSLSRESVERLAGHYVHVLEAIAADADRPLRAIELVCREERRRLLERWSGARRSFRATAACTSCSRSRWRARRTQRQSSLTIVS